jgi:hypothetical protein
VNKSATDANQMYRIRCEYNYYLFPAFPRRDIDANFTAKTVIWPTISINLPSRNWRQVLLRSSTPFLKPRKP